MTIFHYSIAIINQSIVNIRYSEIIELVSVGNINADSPSDSYLCMLGHLSEIVKLRIITTSNLTN